MSFVAAELEKRKELCRWGERGRAISGCERAKEEMPRGRGKKCVSNWITRECTTNYQATDLPRDLPT